MDRFQINVASKSTVKMAKEYAHMFLTKIHNRLRLEKLSPDLASWYHSPELEPKLEELQNMHSSASMLIWRGQKKHSCYSLETLKTGRAVMCSTVRLLKLFFFSS